MNKDTGAFAKGMRSAAVVPVRFSTRQGVGSRGNLGKGLGDIWMPFRMAESARDIVVAEVDAMVIDRSMVPAPGIGQTVCFRRKNMRVV